ncbi:hypothetical protein R3P38DRAFT_2703759, partial [Favolaschia claudopus]
MPPKSAIWELFWTDGSQYGQDRSHRNAWCRCCLDLVVVRIQSEETLSMANGGPAVPQRTGEQWYQTAITHSLRPAPISGKPDKMRRHAARCTAIAAIPDRTRQRDAVFSAMDQSKRTPSEQPPASTSTASPAYQYPPPPPLPNFSIPPPFPSSMSPPSNSLLFSPYPASPSPSMYSNSSLEPPSPYPDSPHLKRRRTSTSSFSQGPPVWAAEQQEEFGQDLCRLFVACGWSWNAVENPQFKIFFQKYLPTAILPSRRILSGRILDQESNKVIQRTRLQIEGKLATYSEDGWSNIAKTHMNTSLLSVDCEPHLLRTHNMTGRPKTGDELFDIVKSDLVYAKETYGVETIAVVTDDGPDGKKMRRLVSEEMPELATFECWAHQISLVTGNFLGIKLPWMESVKLALEVIKWFNHHGVALDLLRGQQQLMSAKTLALILPIVTRWVSQYCSVRRIKKLETPIRTCSFAIAANLLQAPTCRLDTVATCLGNLFRLFDSAPEPLVKKTVQSSLERRWGKTDQELMIL